MDKQEIEDAIERARPGIAQYIEIMKLFPTTVNVADKNSPFQAKYKTFYMPGAFRPPIWHEIYFSYMQQARNSKPKFADVLDHIYQENSKYRYEPSFSSKLAHTLDITKPIWDQFVLANTGIKAPPPGDPKRLQRTKEAYDQLEGWYRDFLETPDGRLIIECFNQKIETVAMITDVKKVDFFLWQWNRNKMHPPLILSK